MPATTFKTDQAPPARMPELPKDYDPKIAEPKWERFWEEQGIHVHEPTPQSVTIDTPPPTVSGRMHIGHASSYAQQDFYARFHRMRTGGKVFFPFGTDDNGLATERLVERTKGVKSSRMSRKDFRELCMQTIRELKPEFVADWKRIGMSCDFSRTYSTIDHRAQATSQRSFLDLFRKGLVFRQETPVSWCPLCQTAIAQAEFENVEMQSTFNDIAFSCEGEPLVIATTRPELIPAVVAIAAHPDDARYAGLAGKKATVPLSGHEVPIVFDEKVEMEKGTGIMMVSTFGDKDDVEKWYKHSLPLRVVFTRDGKLNALAGRYEGLTIKEARKQALEDLKAQGLVLQSRQITHAVNVHERCGTEIEFLKTPQWYIRVLDRKEELLEAANGIAWHPPHMKVRYDHWVENLGWDWCISRQRSFGVPFPVWHDKRDGTIHVADESQLPVDPFVDKPSSVPQAEWEHLEPETDVMDTWATSSVTPQIALGWNDDPERAERLLPMTVRPQAHDIIRTWAFYTIVKSLSMHGTVPWRNIAISGFVTDPHGKKMSKSKGNVVAPQDMIEKYSADAIRYWAAGAKLGDDIPYQEKELVSGKKTATKLWNASRLALASLEGYAGFDGAHADLETADRWLLGRLGALVAACTRAFEEYDHTRAKFALEQFFWNDLCDNYLEIVKGRLYEPKQPRERASAQFALLNALETVLKLLAPFMPHVTEEIYAHLPAADEQGGKARSIHLSAWPLAQQSWRDEEAERVGADMVRVIEAVRKHKSAKAMSMGAPVGALRVRSPADLSAVKADLLSVTRAASLEWEEGEFSVEIG